HAMRGDRVRAPRLRPRGRQLDRVQSRACAQRDRPPPRAAPHHRQGWHDAPGALSDRPPGGQPRLARVRAGDHPGAASPPLRGEQRLSQRARKARTPGLRHLGGEAARRDHRAAGPPVVRRRTVSPGVSLATLGPASALQRLRAGRAGPPGAGLRRRMFETRAVRIGDVTIGGGAPRALIGGPCAIEGESHAIMMAERLRTITAAAGVPFVYKSSYDKANRSSIHSYRGPGLKEGLRILARVKDETGLLVLSDVHDV